MKENWKGKSIIVTGGGGGMGRAAASQFAAAGADVYVFGRTLASLEETAQISEKIIAIVCDVANSTSVDQAMEQVLERGVPDALIHTAGINTADRYVIHEDQSQIASGETWKQMLDINVLGVVNMVQAVSQPMAKLGSGKIVVVTSTAAHGFDSFAGVPYTASKWAVHGLLFTARAQLSKYGVIVSEYAPGEADTPLVEKRPVPPVASHREAMIQTDDCGEALYFIASQPHSVSLIQIPVYQPFGGMPPEISTPWLEGLE